MLNVEDVNIFYDKQKVLHDVSMSVGQKSIIGIFGHNGAGKTSLLKGIFGLLPMTQGSVKFQDADITHYRPSQRVTGGIRLVPQDRNVFPNLTIEDNLQLGALRLSGKSAELTKRFGEVYETFPILHTRRNAKASVLSGGERQMLAISIALMTRPKLLLLDEPSAGLSPIMVQRLFGMIGSVRENFSMSVVLVEQNVKEALRIVDDVIVLEEGRIVFYGPKDQTEQIVRHLWRLNQKEKN